MFAAHDVWINIRTVALYGLACVHIGKKFPGHDDLPFMALFTEVWVNPGL